MAGAITRQVRLAGQVLDKIVVKIVNGLIYYKPVILANPCAVASAMRRGRKFWSKRLWRERISHFYDVERPEREAIARRFAAVDLGALDDDGLYDHYSKCLEELKNAIDSHMRNTDFVLLPIGAVCRAARASRQRSLGARGQ